MALARELDDLVLRLRTNETGPRHLGASAPRATPTSSLAYDAQLRELADDWFVNEVRHYLKRTLKRLDVTSRSLIAVIEPGSCFAGLLAEIALACDRQYMLDGRLRGRRPRTPTPPRSGSPRANDGAYPMGNGLTRLESRFWGHDDDLERRARTHSATASTPPRPTRPAWSPWRSTTSTSRTRSGSCSRSGPRSRPTR